MKTRIGSKSITVQSTEQIEAYAQYFDSLGKWTLRANISFRKVASYAWAKKRLKWFFKYLNQPEKMYFNKTVKVLAFYEKQNTSRAGVHIHALIADIHPRYAKIIENKVKRYFGEFSYVTAYESSRGFKYYLAKKIGSPNLDEYELYIINSKLRYNTERSGAIDVTK